MNRKSTVYPTDILTVPQKCDIYYARVVDLAVERGLLTPDPETEVGCFAYSQHYYEGRKLAERLKEALRLFEKKHPKIVEARARERDDLFGGIHEVIQQSGPSEKTANLIRIGASRRIWPTGTSFVLTYPWDLSGSGRPVTFRNDLNDFMKRRVIAILEKAGKLRSRNLFGD